MPTEDFWQRARAAEIESVATLVFCPEDLLLHLALNLAIHLPGRARFAGPIRTLCDLSETCRRYGQAIDWDHLVSQAEAYQVGKALYYALRLARDLVGASVPAQSLADLRSTFSQLPFEDRFISAVAHEALLAEDPTARPHPTLRALGIDLLGTRRTRDSARLAGRLLARSGRLRLRRLGAGLAARRPRLTCGSSADVSVATAQPEAPSSGASRRHGKSTPPQTAQGERLVPTPGEVAVTYDPGMTDGVGSQLHRIYGLYALARALNLKYVHTPLREVGYQGLIPLLTRRLDPDFTARYNAFFSLPSDDFDLAGCERVRIHSLDESTVAHYRERAATTGRSILLASNLPFGYTDPHPAAYQALREVSPYRGYRPTGPVRVCIHLRRGDNLPDKRGRWLPNSYYLRVCGTVLDVLRQQDAPFVVRLHTEVPSRPYTIYPGTPGLYFVPEQPTTIAPAQCALEEFEAVPNLEMELNAEPLDALGDFATADVLILSLSSFGYLGGLLNPHGLVVSCPLMWHAPLPDWRVADAHGNLDTGEVATRIAGLLRRRG
jgi:hypothetical protein